MTARSTIGRCFVAICLIASPPGASLAVEPDVPLAGDKAAAREIWGTFERWLAAYSSRDLKGTMVIFDREVVFSFQGSPDQGYKELETGYVQDFKSSAPGTEWVPKAQEVYAAANLGFVRSVWELHVKNAAGAVEVKARNRSLDVLRRDNTGSWMIIRSINYPDK